MKKILFLLAILLPLTAQAQVEDRTQFLQPLTISNKFLRRLTKCMPYEEQTPTTMSGFNINATYRIYGLTNKKECEFEFITDTELGYSVSQICYFPPEEMENLVNLFQNYLQKTTYSFDTAAEMVNEAEYREILSMMQNKKYCDYYRDAIDFTKQVRDNLMECKPVWENQNDGVLDISRKIVGKNGSNCQYETLISFKRSVINRRSGPLIDILKEHMDYEENQSILYTCQLDDDELGVLRDILFSMVIPVAKNYDDINENLSNDTQGKEPSFLEEKCTREKL